MGEITQFCQDVAEYIRQFLAQNICIFSNERDMQMHLAIELSQKYGKNNVFLEYYVPGNVFDEGLYRWKQQNKSKGNQDMRVDLVVKKEDEYVPIEIKYKTKIKQENEIKRFGLSMTGITLTKDQSAQDLGRYDFWRDVRRLELLGKKFDKVKNGIAVFLTNDTSYKQKQKDGEKVPNCNQFYLTDNKSESREWENDAEKKYKPARPNFSLYRTYDVRWSDAEKSPGFCFAIVIVPETKETQTND